MEPILNYDFFFYTRAMQEFFERLWLQKAANVAHRYDCAGHVSATPSSGGAFAGDWPGLLWQAVHLWRDRGGGALTTQSELLHAVRAPSQFFLQPER